MLGDTTLFWVSTTSILFAMEATQAGQGEPAGCIPCIFPAGDFHHRSICCQLGQPSKHHPQNPYALQHCCLWLSSSSCYQCHLCKLGARCLHRLLTFISCLCTGGDVQGGLTTAGLLCTSLMHGEKGVVLLSTASRFAAAACRRAKSMLDASLTSGHSKSK